MVTPTSSWTGESQYGGGAFLRLDRGERATIDLGASTQTRVLEPVSWLPVNGPAVSRWTIGDRTDQLRHRVGRQGISAIPGALLPRRLQPHLSPDQQSVSVVATNGQVDLDAVIVRPLISQAAFGVGAKRTQLLTSIADQPTAYPVQLATPAVARNYDRTGRLVRQTILAGSGSAWVAPGGFTVVSFSP